MGHIVRIILKIVIIFPLVFGVIKISDYVLGYHNKIITTVFAVIIITAIEKILIKVYGEKINNFINKWF